jgi:predicted protein tyrosine phosphatase
MEDLKILFVCGKNRLRSPTAEAIFAEYPGLDVDSVGVDRDADNPIGTAAIQWADLILVMEKTHRRKIQAKFQNVLRNKRLVCLDILDNYEYMQPELVAILTKKVLPLLGTFDHIDK